MVFQSRKNRRSAKQMQPEPVFTKLLDELLLRMLYQMDITEVLRLRETSRFFVDTCTEVMRDKLKILYVHPSPSSIERAITICGKPNLSSEVGEICFLSKAPYWNRQQGGENSLLHQRQWAFRNPRDDADRPVRTFDQSYQELLSSLTKLKSLQTCSFQESCDRPGFNMLSAQRITNWQNTLGHRHRNFRDVRRHEIAMPDLNFIYRQAPPKAFLFADDDALIAVLNSGINLTRLILPYELFGDPMPYRFSMHGTQRFLRHTLSVHRPQILTHLDLTVTACWEYCEWHAHSAELIYSAAATLLELRIGIRRSLRQTRNTAGSLRELLGNPGDIVTGMEYIDFPRLQRLELHSPPEWGPCPKQPVSVMVQRFDLDDFLEYHCKELRTLHLTDIDPTETLNSPVNGIDSMKNFRLPECVAAREIEGLGENTRAWEILERTVDESFDLWFEQQLLAMNTT
jgi:hypothetical protein